MVQQETGSVFERLGTTTLRVDCAGKTWPLLRPSNFEALWESIGKTGEEERAPYWAELWPSSLVLCEWLEAHKERIQHARCVDMGCGLGLSALCAAQCGAQVLALDYEFEPLVYAAETQRRLGIPPVTWAVMDWRKPALAQHSADFVWGGDIVYEPSFVETVAEFLDWSLVPGGRAWIVEPNRVVARPFKGAIEQRGWDFTRVFTRSLEWEKHSVTLHLLEIVKKA
ncbi:class I SAM-dependent methyltransferase [Desulfobaculum bizertense]|uniref:class I SAM-dependent methyltransferase n=1 Tax=Desulfobaculum bizertense TaxID=376490 RepID=UPI001F427328|nr:class I SAM-dependent methyltransferase [Desulfobaculum bizertense]UIJ39067.1 class I SAM-dependent methyltransferase [Desulfobaculum bizertense]